MSNAATTSNRNANYDYEDHHAQYDSVTPSTTGRSHTVVDLRTLIDTNDNNNVATATQSNHRTANISNDSASAADDTSFTRLNRLFPTTSAIENVLQTIAASPELRARLNNLNSSTPTANNNNNAIQLFPGDTTLLPGSNNNQNQNSTGVAAIAADNTATTTTTRPAGGTNIEQQQQQQPAQQGRPNDEVVAFVQKVIPFLLLPLLIFLYDHYYGIVVYIWITGFLVSGNERITAQVSLREKRSIWSTLSCVVFIVAQMSIVYLLFKDEQLWKYLIFQSNGTPLNFWNSIWVVVITDSTLKVISMALKAAVILFCAPSSMYRFKGRLYACIESLILIYRSLVPIPVWYRFMVNDYYNVVFSAIVAGLYITVKVRSLVGKAKHAINMFKYLIFSGVQYGRRATAAEVAEAGNSCSVCRDEFVTPIVLDCDHIFCEACIAEWFERENTCPLCRQVHHHAGDKKHTDGSTSLSIVLI